MCIRDRDNSFQTNQINQDSLKTALKQDSYAIQPLKRMLTNIPFRQAFVQRAASHLNITYTPARVTATINTLHDEIEPEMPFHILRWKKPKTMTAWETEVTKMRTFAAQLPPRRRRPAEQPRLGQRVDVYKRQRQRPDRYTRRPPHRAGRGRGEPWGSRGGRRATIDRAGAQS